jgi:hypothetical protein
MPNQKTQVGALADKVTVPNTETPPEEQDLRSVFPSPLVLTVEQEQRMIDYIDSSIDDMAKNLGRNSTSAANWYNSDDAQTQRVGRESFMGRRQLFEMVYANQMEWRATLVGGIFAESNHTVPLCRRIVQQQFSRAVNYFMGTDPWFSAYPVGPSDAKLGELTDKYLKFKGVQSDLKGSCEQGVMGAFIRGETVMKTVWKKVWTNYKTQAVVAIDTVTGQPIVASDNDYIYATDKWMQPAAPEGTMEGELGEGLPPAPGEGIDSVEGVVPSLEMEKAASAGFVLVRDGVTGLPEGAASPEELAFEPRTLDKRSVQFQGADAKPVYFRDFLCPLDATSVDEAPICCHLYDKPAIEIAQLYVATLADESTPKEQAIRIYAALQELLAMDGGNKSAANSARPQLGESSDITTEDQDVSNGDESRESEQIMEIAEVYLRYDADEDGAQEEIMCLYDRKNKRPLFYDYLANRSPAGKRPFGVLRINPVEGRWYGTGSVEVFLPIQEAVDLLLNRWNMSLSREGSVVFWNPSLTLEGEQNPNLELNGGETYTPKGNIDPEQILKVIPLHDIKGRNLHEEIEFLMQVAMNMSGITQANDAAMLGMDTGKLATGVRNIEQSGQELFSVYLSQLQRGLESVLKSFIQYSMAYLDTNEAFMLTEDREAAVMEFDPTRIESLDFDIRMEMTRYRNEQELAQSQAATAKVIEFYGLPPEMQQVLRPLYLQQLKAFQIPDADRFLVPGLQLPAAPGSNTPPGGIATSGSGGMPGKSPPNF